MHQALYRKYRPSTFDDVIGQEHITSVLTWEVANQKVNHAYVFCGSAGTGKTSCAKILAKAVNCEHPINGNPCNACHSCREIDAGASMEVVEMDAASNTGVDYIRDIKEDVIFTPSEQGTKVYIIDEVHMLSESAFNALLKTLEEPPKNVIFVLATTELQDIPATILSRCQRFDFKRLNTDDIIERLNYIAKQESYILEKEAAVLLAHLSQGGMRDAVSLFELCIDQTGKITERGVRDAAGIVGRDTVVRTVTAVADSDTESLFTIISDIHRSSKELSVFFSDLITFYRDMLVCRVMKLRNAGENRAVLDLSEQDFKDVLTLSGRFTKEKLLYHIKLLEEAYITMYKSEIKRITAEITLMRMSLAKYDSSYEALEARIAELENTAFDGGSLNKAPITASSEKIASQAEKASQMTNLTKTEARPIVLETSSQPAEKVLSQWIDIIDAYSARDPGSSSFLKNSKATYRVESQVLTVWVSEAFTKMMLDKANAATTIASLCARQGIVVSAVTIAVIPKTLADDDPLSDLFS